jgi:hypothetical protein
VPVLDNAADSKNSDSPLVYPEPEETISAETIALPSTTTLAVAPFQVPDAETFRSLTF